MRVIPLGTASGRPTVERNVSATAVVRDRSWILVDCGEATQHQILRSPVRLSRLELVLITHLHGDHVLGLPGLLSSAGIEDRTDPLTIVGPAGLAGWLGATAATPMLQLPFALAVHELDAAAFADDDEPHPVVRLDGAEVTTLPLRHRVPCFGYRVTEDTRPGRLDPERARRLGVTEPTDLGRLQRGETVDGDAGPVAPSDVTGPTRPGLAVAVMGDTMPCDAAVRLARNADLLVHEATYRDSEAALGRRWQHSTAGQAGEIAARAAARRLVITHFSARYEGTDGLLSDARAAFDATEVAVERRPIEVRPGDDRGRDVGAGDVTPSPSLAPPPTS